jgi:hypothetical protein
MELKELDTRKSRKFAGTTKDILKAERGNQVGNVGR